MYPNPFSDQIIIECSSNKNQIQAALINYLGQEILNQESTTGENLIISTTQITPGNYILKLFDGDNYFHSPLIKL